MSKMLYKAGGHTNVWGRAMHAEVVSSERVEEYLARGWYANPKDVPVKAPEPLPDAATTSLTGGDATPVDMGDAARAGLDERTRLGRAESAGTIPC